MARIRELPDEVNVNPFALSPESQHITQLFGRMNEQLIEKRISAVTVEDLYNLHIDEEKAFYVIKQAVQRLPLRLRVPLRDLQELHGALEEDFVATKAWQDKYSRDRERLERINLFQERHLEARPNFRILKLKYRGKYIRFTISEKVQEFEFRVRQAIASFHQLIEAHCSLYFPPLEENRPLTPIGESCLTPYDSFIYEPKHSFDTLKIRFPIDCSTAPYPFDNYSPIFSHSPDQQYLPDKYPADFFKKPHTRVPSRDYFINPDGDLIQNCLGYMKLFVEFAIQKGNLGEHQFARFLPYVPVHENEAPLDSPLNSI